MRRVSLLILPLVQDIYLETQDAELLKEGEEVTLMDWGNAIIKASHFELSFVVVRS